jgi:predicted esterase
MKKEVFKIWPQDDTVTLTVFSLEDSPDNKPTVIVLPGGAYVAPAPKEADPVAEHFASMGYLGCVLRASTMYMDFDHTYGDANPHTRFPEPMQELASAIKFLRDNAEKFGIRADGIAIMGFSAGGHLAANYGNYWNSDKVIGAMGYTPEQAQPNACVLCYAATKLLASVPKDMVKAAFGVKESYEQREVDEYNAYLHVSSDTPPTFIWHTADDSVVPVSLSYELAAAMHSAGVPCEVHVFSNGPHAAALSTGLPAQRWPELADSFLKRYM